MLEIRKVFFFSIRANEACVMVSFVKKGEMQKIHEEFL